MKVNSIVVSLLILLLVSACASTYPVRIEDRPQVDEIIKLSKSLFSNPDFNMILESMAADDFDHSADSDYHINDNGSDVLANLKSHSINGVVCRRARTPFNYSTNAWEGNGTPQLRCSFLSDRSNEIWVGTIIHEQAHAAGYLHNGNSRSGNECTVPHVVGDLAVFIMERKNGFVSLPKDSCPDLRDAISILK